MNFSDFIGSVMGEVTRQSVARITGEQRVLHCAECGSTAVAEFHARQPCCGRLLCAACAQDSLIYCWPQRVVLRCDHCQVANTFPLPS